MVKLQSSSLHYSATSWLVLNLRGRPYPTSKAQTICFPSIVSLYKLTTEIMIFCLSFNQSQIRSELTNLYCYNCWKRSISLEFLIYGCMIVQQCNYKKTDVLGSNLGTDFWKRAHLLSRILFEKNIMSSVIRGEKRLSCEPILNDWFGSISVQLLFCYYPQRTKAQVQVEENCALQT